MLMSVGKIHHRLFQREFNQTVFGSLVELRR